MNPFANLDWKAQFSQIVLIVMYIASAAISALWFAQTMPTLFVPADSPLPSWAGPLTSAIVGVGFMEAAVIAWNYQVKQAGLTGGQLILAWIGLLSSLGMSAITSFAAIMQFVGGGAGEISSAVVAFGTGSGVAIYITLQVLLALFSKFLFNPVEAPARRPTVRTGGNQQAQINRPSEAPALAQNQNRGQPNQQRRDRQPQNR